MRITLKDPWFSVRQSFLLRPRWLGIISIIAGDGKKLTIEAQLHNLISAMASFAPPPPGQINLTEQYQQQLSTLLTTSWK